MLKAVVVRALQVFPRLQRCRRPGAHAFAWLAAALLAALSHAPLQAAHGIAWGEALKYPQGFSHFDYVNPAAPKGGSINLDGYGSFDKLNPFTLKGIAAAGIGTLMFETLAEPSKDEPFSMYGLLADDIRFAEDGLSITFRLNAAARFSDGSPVTAEDVRHSFVTLTSRQAHPRYRQSFADVAQVRVINSRTIRFDFKRRNHELHMIIGIQMPVFSRNWGKGKNFTDLIEDEPIASGPYRIERIEWGRSIVFRRNPNYWANDLNVRRGMFNFDRIVYKYFKDETARLEGFKAGEFDWIYENSARNWARGHTGPRYASGELVKREFPHSNAAGMQGFALNARRPQFSDVRVRRAIALAMDFEWMNRQVFYGQYRRTPSYFTNTDMVATGEPDQDELTYLEPLRKQLAPEVFGEVPLPPTTAAPSSLRANLRLARSLLMDAGWRVDDEGVLRNAAGQAFAFEFLTYSKAFERVAESWVRNLAKLGIEVTMRTTDPALYRKRIEDYDFDAIVHVFSASQTPGNELVESYTSGAAAEKGSQNMPGIRDPAIDALVSRILESRSRPELAAGARALDRVLRHGYYMVPHFHAPANRVAFSKRLGHPETIPRYYWSPTWMLKTWWVQPDAAGARSR
ncbi:MAG: ABC transporter substrate-binding protein [Betaproteobacteria bacterium]|nr:ABC transporter substrate-binding protein [Betaproteobacteria bacterium]